DLIEILQGVQEIHPDLQAVTLKALGLRARLQLWQQPDAEPTTADEPSQAQASADLGPAVRWVEAGQTHLRLHRAPLSVAGRLGRHRPAHQAWVLTSATLSLKGDFGHFQRQLGLSQAQTASWPSPFEYDRQA